MQILANHEIDLIGGGGIMGYDPCPKPAVDSGQYDWLSGINKARRPPVAD